MTQLIACVSGASGTVGIRVCEHLLSRGYRVRVLSRQKSFSVAGADSFTGSILNENELKAFMQNAHLFFHCAAELKDESRMWEVNVRGTELVLKYAELFGIKYFCYLSSVGVIGQSALTLVDESAQCNPQNMYEKSKLAAERLVARGIKSCAVIILRPTNVIDEKKPGVLLLPRRGSLLDLCKVFIKGGECAHIVHSDDVALAALHFICDPPKTPQCYIVSCDNEPLNTVAGTWALYKAYQNNKSTDNLRPAPYLPIFIPYILRMIRLRRSNFGDIRYSSKKLLDTGFVFKLGLKGAVKRIASASVPV